MIESNQLRLGNWVYNTHNIPMVVKTIGIDYIYVDFKNNPGDLLEFNTYNPFKPIPLTEEILLKCGFEKKDGLFVFNNVVIWSRNDIFNYEGLKYIKSLHQLQNLYFALTNKELNIEL